MSSHWHFVLQPTEDGGMSDFLRWVTLTHTQRYHAHYGTSGEGHLYQGRIKSLPFQDQDDDDHTRDIGLELDERFSLGQLPVPAVRAARRQGKVIGFVDLLGHRSAMVLAMILVALATRLFRVGFAFFAERCCLAFALAFNFLKTRREQLELHDQHVDDRLLLFKQRLAIETIGRDLGHIQLKRRWPVPFSLGRESGERSTVMSLFRECKSERESNEW